MAEEYGSREREETGTLTVGTLLNDERAWLTVALLAGSIVVTSYYLTHPYPSYATALFPHMAEVLLENGYRRPETIPYYTENGVPFAYPPLMFYVMAVMIDIGIDPIQITRDVIRSRRQNRRIRFYHPYTYPTPPLPVLQYHGP